MKNNKYPNLKHKILYLDHGAKPIGGGQMNILALLKELDRNIFDPIIISSKENSFTDQAKEFGVRVVVLKYSNTLTSTYRSNIGGWWKRIKIFIDLFFLNLRIARFVRQEKIEIIHPCDNVSKIACLFSYFGSKASIVSHITDDLENNSTNRILRQIIYLTHDRIMPVSNKVGEFFKSNLKYSHKVNTVYTGIDLEYFCDNELNNRSLCRDQLHIGINEIVIGIVGLLIPIKGHRELFFAASELNNKNNHHLFRYLVVGDGPERVNLERLARELGIQNNVIFTGFTNDVVQMLSALDLIVVPSHSEASSRVILEAAAVGVPAIGTRIGGIPEMIEEGVTGVLVDLGDVPGLTDAILRFTDPTLRLVMGRRARQRVSEKFSNKAITAQIQHIYASVIARHNEK